MVHDDPSCLTTPRRTLEKHAPSIHRVQAQDQASPMVRRVSTVRVRQRASDYFLLRAGFGCCDRCGATSASQSLTGARRSLRSRAVSPRCLSSSPQRPSPAHRGCSSQVSSPTGSRICSSTAVSSSPTLVGGHRSASSSTWSRQRSSLSRSSQACSSTTRLIWEAQRHERQYVRALRGCRHRRRSGGPGNRTLSPSPGSPLRDPGSRGFCCSGVAHSLGLARSFYAAPLRQPARAGFPW